MVTDSSGYITFENKPTIPTQINDLTDVETVEVVVTYTDNSTETLNLLAQSIPQQNNGE